MFVTETQDYTVPNDRIVNEQQIGNDMKEKDCSLEQLMNKLEMTWKKRLQPN